MDENKRQALGYQYTQDVVAKLGQLQGDLAESLCTSEKGKSDCKKTSADSGIDSAVVSKKIDSLVASCQRANLGQFRPVTSVLSEYLLGCAKAKAPETCNLPVASIPNGPNSLAESAGFLEPQCGCRVSPALTSKTE